MPGKFMKAIFEIFIYLLIFILFCSNPPSGPVVKNENIVLISEPDNFGGEHNIALWLPNEIYTGFLFRRIEIDDNFRVISKTIVRDTTILYTPVYKNKELTKILLIKQKIIGLNNILYYGALLEYDLQNKTFTLLRDESHNINSAAYYHNGNKIIYYSFGNNEGKVEGFYLLDNDSNDDMLIFNYMPDIDFHYLGRAIYNFDIHPFDNKIIFPVVNINESPLLCEYNLDDKTFDTLTVKFDEPEVRNHLWIRYNENGDKLLYCNYEQFALCGVGAVSSEIGIINLAAQSKIILDVHARPEKSSRYQSLFPDWSPDYNHIVFVNGSVSRSDNVGDYYVFVLKNVN